MVVTRQFAGERRGMATDPARPDPPKKHRSRRIWVRGLLALACVGLLMWALSLNSDLDDADATNAQAAETGDISAAGGLLKGEDRESVKSTLQGITSDCQAAFADAGAG